MVGMELSWRKSMGRAVVEVWGKRYTLETYQQSKSVWIASGEYMDEPHDGRGRSPGAAAKRWQEWAHTKGG
jgi:hypothetical protein